MILYIQNKQKMKNIYYLNLLILLLVLIPERNNSEFNSTLSRIIKDNINIIKQIDNNISSYKTNNNIFFETKKIIKNISYGNELFEEEYNYEKSISNINHKKIKKEESLYQRLIPETLFEYNYKISCYNLIPVKAMAKDDTGNFVSNLLLIGQNNKIIISDLLGNIYLTYNTSYLIDRIITFNQNDINFFYILSNNSTEIHKFYLSYNTYFNNSTNINKVKDIIKVETYTEDEKREKVESFSYELYDIYKQNINYKKIEIIEEKNISFILDENDEYIISINPINIKGTNYLMIITNKYSVYKLNYKNLVNIYNSTLDDNYINNISRNLMPISLNFYYILFNKIEKGYFIIKYDYNSTLLGKCDLFLDNSTEKIEQYFFEEKSKTIYIVSSLNKIYLSIPILLPSNENKNKNACKNIFLSELDLINKENINNTFDLTLLDKKLMITKDGINFEVVDITKVGEVDNTNKLQTKFFDLNKYIHNINHFHSLIVKDNKKFLFLKQTSENTLILFTFCEKSAKIYASESQGFNFKVPIILVAFAVILVWNYIKSKNEGTDNELNQFKSKYK